MPGILIPRTLFDVLSLTEAPYRPIRMCDMPKDSFSPADMLQIVLDP